MVSGRVDQPPRVLLFSRTYTRLVDFAGLLLRPMPVFGEPKRTVGVGNCWDHASTSSCVARSEEALNSWKTSA